MPQLPKANFRRYDLHQTLILHPNLEDWRPRATDPHWELCHTLLEPA